MKKGNDLVIYGVVIKQNLHAFLNISGFRGQFNISEELPHLSSPPPPPWAFIFNISLENWASQSYPGVICIDILNSTWKSYMDKE